MKSGTTTVFEILANHSKIAPAIDKEPGFFAFDTIWNKGYQWYHSLFDFDPHRHTYRLEASTDYTKSPFVKHVWTRMCAYPDKEFKLIYVMRDPVRRLESHARHVQISRKELGQTISPRTSHSLDEGLSVISMSTSQYAYQLSQFTGAVEANSVHFVLFEELRRDPRKVFSELFAFLELSAENVSDVLPQFNAAAQKVQMSPMWGRFSSNPFLMAAGNLILPKALRNSIKGKFRRKVRVTGRFKFSQSEENALAAFLMATYQSSPKSMTLEFPKSGAFRMGTKGAGESTC